MQSTTKILAVIIISGFLFILLGEVLYLDITGLGKKKARRELPVLASEMGFVERDDTVLDTWAGQYNGYTFTITPFDDALIMLDMQQIRGLSEISTVKGEQLFSSGNKIFDQHFQQREADATIAERTKEGINFQDSAISFCNKWQRKSAYIELTSDAIYCSLKYGSSSYIPAQVLKKIIPDMVKLADAIQHDLGGQ